MAFNNEDMLILKDDKDKQTVRMKRLKIGSQIVNEGVHKYNRTEFNNTRHKL